MEQHTIKDNYLCLYHTPVEITQRTSILKRARVAQNQKSRREPFYLEGQREPEKRLEGPIGNSCKSITWSAVPCIQLASFTLFIYFLIQWYYRMKIVQIVEITIPYGASTQTEEPERDIEMTKKYRAKSQKGLEFFFPNRLCKIIGTDPAEAVIVKNRPASTHQVSNESQLIFAKINRRGKFGDQLMRGNYEIYNSLYS